MHQSLYFLLPDLLQESVFDKKEAMAQDISSKGIRNTQLWPVTCLRVQQSAEGLRNQISYSGKEKSTSKYVVWQYILRKHKKKNTDELSSPPHFISSVLWFIPFPFQTWTGSWWSSRSGFSKPKQQYLISLSEGLILWGEERLASQKHLKWLCWGQRRYCHRLGLGSRLWSQQWEHHCHFTGRR